MPTQLPSLRRLVLPLAWEPRQAGCSTILTTAAVCCLVVFLVAVRHLVLETVTTGGASSVEEQQVEGWLLVDSLSGGTEAGAKPLTYPIWWHAPFYTGSGYGSEAVSYVMALLSTGRVRAEDLWVTHSGDGISSHALRTMEPDIKIMLQEQEYSALKAGRIPEEDLERPAIVICHSFPECWAMHHDEPSPAIAPGCPCPPDSTGDKVIYRVGRTMFETAGLPDHLVRHCNTMDEVWVPTEFNRATFAAAGVDPGKLQVVPQAVDLSYFDPSQHAPFDLKTLRSQQVTGPRHSTVNPVSAGEAVGPTLDGTQDSGPSKQPSKPYVFLSVFKWETRKGWDVLLDAYLSEFTAQEHVELHIMTHPLSDGSKQDIHSELQTWLVTHRGYQQSDLRRLPQLFIHTLHINDTTYPRLYASSDAVVLPTRGEGWGRPQMEAMAMAKPLITTNWSGPTAFINDRVAYPLAVEGLTDASSDMNLTNTDAKQLNEYFQGQQWAKPSIIHLKQLMRQVYQYPTEAAVRGVAARAHILEHFTPEVVADSVLAAVHRIQKTLSGLAATSSKGTRPVPVMPRVRSAALSFQCTLNPFTCNQGPVNAAEGALAAMQQLP